LFEPLLCGRKCAAAAPHRDRRTARRCDDRDPRSLTPTDRLAHVHDRAYRGAVTSRGAGGRGPMIIKNYYLVLGVPRDEQDPRGIRDAYRQLAKQYHPDRAGPEGATAFRDVVEAYEVLYHDEQPALHHQGLRRAEGRLDVAPDSIVLADDVPPEPLAPVPVSIPRGFRHVGPSLEELLDRILHNLLTARARKAERLQALGAELVLSAAEVQRRGR